MNTPPLQRLAGRPATAAEATHPTTGRRLAPQLPTLPPSSLVMTMVAERGRLPAP